MKIVFNKLRLKIRNKATKRLIRSNTSYEVDFHRACYMMTELITSTWEKKPHSKRLTDAVKR